MNLSVKNWHWEKLSLLLKPDPRIPWMSTFTGSCSAIQVEDSSQFDLCVTGRDAQNRSLIGRVRIDLSAGSPKIIEISNAPVFSHGEIGAFDENGVSYPYLVKHDQEIRMYYTGWMPTVITPFQNHVGLAILNSKGQFERISRAPILDRTNDDYLSTGSVCVLKEESQWKMWYTSFTKWGVKPHEPKHSYIIKYATSENGIEWQRNNQICINLQYPGEHSISRPAVLKTKDGYVMWYCTRGEEYRIGYAQSRDGINWQRQDHASGIELSKSGWDSKAQCYPFVFNFQNQIYMLYCGNGYGREGLGIARLKGSL